MKILKTAYHKRKWDGKEVVVLPIKDLWASVPIALKLKNRDFYEPLKEDIEKNGLHFPLLVVSSSEAQLREQKEKYKNKLLPLPKIENDHIYVIWGGSNRIKVAQELKYTHIDCVVFENGAFSEAHKKQKLHRKPYKNLYGY